MKFKNDIIIAMIIFAVIFCGYIIGVNTVMSAYCNDENDENYEESEIWEEYAELGAEDEEFRNSFSNSNLEIEIAEEIPSENFEISEDLTVEEDCAIVLSDEEIIMVECGLAVIDEITLIDSYDEGNWYCYYLFSDGDVYVVTLKNGSVDVCVQLN